MIEFTKELASSYAQAARRCYDMDGQANPIIAFHSEAGPIICQVTPPTGDVPAAYGAITYMVVPVQPPDIIVTVNEGWKQEVAHEPGDPIPELRKGELGEMAAAGDTSVKTCLITAVWTLDDRCTMTIDTCLEGGTYEREQDLDPRHGNLADQVLGSWKQALIDVAEHPVPPEIDMEHVAGLLGMLGLVGAMTMSA